MSIDTDLGDSDTDTTPAADELETIGEPTTTEENLVEVRRRPGVAAALGAGSSLVSVAYLARAAGGGGAVDWLLAGILGLVGVVNLAALLDARTPLLVADALGVRLRLGRTWVGLPWGGLDQVEHRPRRAWWCDGLLVVRTHYVQRVLEELDRPARRTARLNGRLHHSPFAVPLGVGTRVVGATGGLTAALRDLADGRAVVAEQEPEPRDSRPEPAPKRRHLPDPRPAMVRVAGLVTARLQRSARTGDGVLTRAQAPDEERERPVEASHTPAPARPTVAPARSEVRRDAHAEVERPELLDDGGEDPRYPDREPEAEGALLIDDYVAQPAPDPMIGPQFAAARERLGLSVDSLADRTRIRPHVIEAIEVDDFSICGGDFYARGHLRTLARVLGIDTAPILATYDDRYADAPIDPRRVFEAELAGAGSIRATRGGPNWSVLVAAVMALVLCWSVARLVTGGPDQSHDQAVLSGSGGPNHQTSVPVGDPVPVTLIAAGGGARVVVRDGNGRLVFSGDLAFGQRHTVRAATPVHVQSTDGSVQVMLNGEDRGHVGSPGRPATQSYAARG